MNQEIQEYLTQATMMMKLEKPEEALSYLEKAEALDQMEIEVYFRKGEVLIILDRYEEAVDCFERALLIDKNSGEAFFHLGNIAMLQQDFQKCKGYYTKAIANGYDSAQVYFSLALLCEQYDDYDNALFYLNKAIAEDKTRADALLRKIELLVLLNRQTDAITACDDLIEVHPDVFEGYHYKYLILVDRKEFDKAEALLAKAMKLFPNDEGFAFDQIRLLSEKGDFDEALVKIDRLIDLSESELPLEIYREKARILLGLEKPDEAQGLLEVISESEYDDNTYFYLINIYMAKGLFEQALQACEKVIEEQEETPTYYSALYYKGMALKKLNKNEEARAAFENAVKEMRFACSANPLLLDLYTLRALSYRELKDYDMAFEMIEYILNVSDEIAEAYLIRSELYKDVNEPEKAEADLQKAKEMNSPLRSLLNGGNDNG